MTSASLALQDLLANVPPEWVSVIAAKANYSLVNARVCEFDGAVRDHKLVLQALQNPERLVVSEGPNCEGWLPRFCPDRHIFGEGGFCLGHPTLFDTLPSTPAAAQSWWATLHGFLRDQMVAEQLRRWPNRPGAPSLAHGVAANYQLAFEIVARGLPEPVAQAVLRGEVQLGADGKQIKNRRALCPCGSGRAVKNCSHEKTLAVLVCLKAMELAQSSAYAAALQLAGVRCCGTVDSCPLRCAEAQQRC